MNPFVLLASANTNAGPENTGANNNTGTGTANNAAGPENAEPMNLTDIPGEVAAKTNQFWTAMSERFDSQFWINALIVCVKIALVLLIGRLIIFIVNKSIDKVLERESKVQQRTRRVVTMGRLLKNVASYVVYFITAMLVLPMLSINIGPLLAGAGVLGLAIGFGAQSLVKDVISGFFIVLEDQFAVGDVIQTGTFKGTVELIGLRTTRLKTWTGEVHIIPNGLIAQVTNFSLNHSLAVVDVDLPNHYKPDEAADIIREMLEKLENPNLVKVPDLLGVASLTTADYKLRIVAECLPNTEAVVSRQINMELQRLLRGRDEPQEELA
ncbi:mechanosensitive ion channel family protein [Paenibacillus herberti]|uniref:Mechanosensitive ion channel protein MscS n=1 Tax=Paenibacillus herberti TaxID=1619309 RepID=A0A229NXH7_9BACL|nr:mechanosensitive ion channel family protein [Paenibacillus herberti]OXM14501.1 mechanosensitive ion channel protein MscS [Paenibacillus herberti]